MKKINILLVCNAGMSTSLLGPQVRFKEKQIRALVEEKIPVSVIDMSAYGTMNGEKVLQQALSLTAQ